MPDPTPTTPTVVPPPNPYATAPLPVPGQLPPGNYGSQAQAIMNPIYDDATTRAAANANALQRAIGSAQQEATARVNSVGSATNAPSAALAQVNSIPQAALANIQNRALAYQASNAQQLAGGRTAETAGLANNLNAQGFAGSMAAAANAAKVNALTLKAQLTAAKPTYTINGISGLSPAEALLYQQNQGKASTQAQAVQNSTIDNATSALSKLIDPKTGLPTDPTMNLSQAYQQAIAPFVLDMQRHGLTSADFQKAFDTYRSGLNANVTAEYGTGPQESFLTVNGKNLPTLYSQIPAAQQSNALKRALTDYQTNAAQVGIPGGKTALMQGITAEYGSQIAQQVRDAAKAAGSNLKDYLA